MNILMLSEISGTLGIKNSLIEKLQFFVCDLHVLVHVLHSLWERSSGAKRYKRKKIGPSK